MQQAGDVSVVGGVVDLANSGHRDEDFQWKDRKTDAYSLTHGIRLFYLCSHFPPFARHRSGQILTLFAKSFFE
ncbi:hypothetical protein [Bradyrhizobium jicamae]|uniref:hypothetical protein n=1 Tax=Bradyrhizobium jicamae TaxID=280332 RepID=UPI001BA4CA98|nr:hypothetical protein [Bradyrhizobium jicamae]